jgi:hypothetical protein
MTHHARRRSVLLRRRQSRGIDLLLGSFWLVTVLGGLAMLGPVPAIVIGLAIAGIYLDMLRREKRARRERSSSRRRSGSGRGIGRDL